MAKGAQIRLCEILIPYFTDDFKLTVYEITHIIGPEDTAKFVHKLIANCYESLTISDLDDMRQCFQ